MAVVKSDIIVIKNVISELRVEMRSGFDRATGGSRGWRSASRLSKAAAEAVRQHTEQPERPASATLLARWF